MIQRLTHYVETLYVVLDPRVDDIRASYDPGATVKELGQTAGADLALNFNFADTSTGIPIGRLIVDGVTVIPDIPKTEPRDELYMLPDGSIHIGKAPAAAVWAVQGSPRLLRGGKNVIHESLIRDQTPDDIKRKAIRTAAGITADGRLVLARTLGAVYLSEMAEIMQRLGCVDALNGDGGGSSYMWPHDTGWGRKLGAAIVVRKGDEAKNMKIVIDAGHGPDTPGKRSPDGSLREYQFNSVVAQYVADDLLHGYEGVEILFTHDDSRDVPLKERTDRANEWGADLYVSIHANASGDTWSDAQGIETYVYTSRPPAAMKLAEAVQQHLVRMTGRRDRGVKSANFHVLRETRMTAILVECGFMTNMVEAAFLKTDDFRKKCALAIAAGIAETYGLKKKDPAQNVPEPANEFPKIAGTARVLVNDQDIGAGYLIDGRTYVPLRAIGEALGLQVGWDQATKTATLKGGA